MVEILWSGERAWLRSPLFAPVILALFAATLLVSAWLGGFGENQAWGYDFDAFYTGAQMTLEGRLNEAYDAGLFQRELPGSEDMYWMYPPHAAMVIAPLGLPPYWLSAALLLLALAASTFGLGRRVFGDARGGNALLLLSVPGLFALLLGQVAPLFGAALVAALLAAPKRPILAGLLLAFLTFKPQYGLLVPLFLLVRRDWRTIVAASLGTALLLFLSVLTLGLDAWAAWLEHADGPASAFIYENLYSSMPSVHHYVRFFGAPDAWAGPMQAAAVILGLGLVALTRQLDHARHAALTLLLTCAVMPYLWFYDWLPVMAVVLLAMRAGPAWAVPRRLLAALWLAPFASEISEPLLTPMPYAVSLLTTQIINAGELVAVWGTVLALAYPAFRTTALPVFAPEKSPMNASGPLSSPS